MVFTLTLNYQLAPDESDIGALVDRLAEEGCDDALVGVGQPGRIALEFMREAPTADDGRGCQKTCAEPYLTPA